MGEFVSLEVAEGVGTIRLDRPPANAIDPRVSGELLDAAAEATEREDVGALVVWGGPRIFAAGADIKVMAGFGPDEARALQPFLGDACDAIERIPKVVIAAVNGYALGGGCELAMAADLRYAGEDATLGQPEIGLGVIPGAGGTQRLARLVGPARAKELVFSGRHVEAPEALALGLVDRVLPSEDVYAAALEEARGYATGPRLALAAAKQAVDAALGDPVRGAALERELFFGLFATQDQKEGMRAFLEKREPRFRGR